MPLLLIDAIAQTVHLCLMRDGAYLRGYHISFFDIALSLSIFPLQDINIGQCSHRFQPVPPVTIVFHDIICLLVFLLSLHPLFLLFIKTAEIDMTQADA